MAAVAFALPILSGKEEMDRDAFEEMSGSRREEYRCTASISLSPPLRPS